MAQPNVVENSPDLGRDPRLSWFASGGRYDRERPDAGMASALETVTDTSGRPPAAASDDEVIGQMGNWQALEAHAHARLLATVREIIRRRPADGFPATYPGDLPARWDPGVAHEVAAQLRISWQAATPLAHLAWELEARLPDIGRLLDAGILTGLKVKIVTEEFSVLDDEKVAEAEKLLLDEDLAGDEMTPGRLRKLCQRIADTTDPEGARRRREEAARDRARVSFYRAHGGDTAMFAEGLPADEALRAQANIQARALDYKRAMVYPEAGMDFRRVLALVDLINGLTLDQRITRYHAEHAAAEDARNAAQRSRDQETAESLARYRPNPPVSSTSATGTGTSDRRDGSNRTNGNGSGGPQFEWPGDEDDPAAYGYGDDPDKPAPPLPAEEPGDLDDDCCFWPGYGPGPGGATEPDGPRAPYNGPENRVPGNDGPAVDDDGGGPETGDPGNGGPGGTGPRPGATGPGWIPPGAPDPGLPALTHLTLPLATLLRLANRPGEAQGYGSIDPGLVRDLAQAAVGSPRSRFCLTIADDRGHAAAHGCAREIRPVGREIRTGRETRTGVGSRDGPPVGWNLAPDHARTGPDGGYGAWVLTVPGGRRFRLDLHPVPVYGCDHRYATGAYRPGALLRHLVEVRDGECTFTGCSHPASRCDFEHALPYDKGGLTDACNAGARSRKCHQVKQSKGWSVTQPEPGWHEWHTPSGRTYTKGPQRYLA